MLEKKKKDFSFSLMFVPHKGARVRTLKISHKNMVRLFWVIGSLSICTVVVATGLVLRYKYINNQFSAQQSRLAKMDQLAEENEQQKAKLLTLNAEAQEMKQKLDSLNSLAGKISSILKIKHVDVSRGISGPDTEVKFSDLSEQAAKQEEVLNSYLEPAENHADYLNHRPSIMPKYGRITSPYGYRSNPFTGRGSELHDGIDIEANYGDSVRATADGVVSFAGWDYGYGLKVEINHGYGIRTFYGHNSKLNVKVGQRVKRGDVIAYAGSTGRSTGVHVHWGATLYGRSVNPLNFINSNK